VLRQRGSTSPANNGFCRLRVKAKALTTGGPPGLTNATVFNVRLTQAETDDAGPSSPRHHPPLGAETLFISNPFG